MTTYPDGKAELRRFLSEVSDMVATDLNVMFDVAVAIETELGIKPAGRMGTIFGRLFARGNLSKIDGKWRRLEWGVLNNIDSAVFDELTPHYKLGFSSNRFLGIETKFGEGVPAVFLSLQATGANYSGWPWNIIQSKAENDFARFWARDASTGSSRLSTANRRTDTKIGYLVWGMI